jgi:Trk K+ transport system NAD-binding subunit
MSPMLGPFERRTPHRELAGEAPEDLEEQPRILVLGLGRYGHRLARRLREAELRVLGVDCDPELVRRLSAEGFPVRFGDGQDPAFLDSLPLDNLRWAISTLPDLESNRMLVQALMEHGFTGEIAVVARDEEQGAALWRLGVPIILYPFRDAVDFATDNIIAMMRRQGGKHAGPASDAG